MSMSIHQFDSAANRFLPPDGSLDLDVRRRERMFVIAHLISPICVAILAAMVYGLADIQSPQFFALVAGFASFHVYPLLLNRYLSFRTASYLSTAQLTVLVISTVYFFGGWTSFALPWIMALPMVGMLYLGFRGAYSTSALALAGVLILLALDLFGQSFANPISPPGQTIMLITSIALCIIFNTGIAFFHVRLNNLSKIELQERDRLSVHVQRLAHLGVWEIDYSTNKMTFSDEAFRIVGLARAAFDGTQESFLNCIHKDDRAQAKRNSGRLALRQKIDFTCRIVRPDGVERVVNIQGDATQIKNDKALQARGFIHDISESAEAEAALRAAKRESDLANQAKSEFLANMSHELRTPLNAIMGFSEMISLETFGPVGSPRYREYADDIHQSGAYLLNFIGDILDLSKIEAGRYVLDKTEIKLADVAASCLRMVDEQAEAAECAIETNIPDFLPLLRADERACHQIILNLLSNSIKFTPPGGRISLKSGVVSEGGLWFSVSDSGIGIPADEISRVIEPFTQVDGSLSRKNKGTGLGLSLVHSLCTLHGAALQIESEVGNGTEVTVRFPARHVISLGGDSGLAIAN
ncbi:MAG: PAS domain-containing sensor histidine kinase [Rhodospirillaceae bacterium]|nr:PAS domain-containing sensor histidine kinase [Rhodospirillaceae bacterium]